MKKMNIFKYMMLCSGIAALSSCADYLDNAPDDTLTMEMIFNDKTRTEDCNGLPIRNGKVICGNNVRNAFALPIC